MPKKPSNPFFEKYKDPRWQKKRLEIMQRDNFECKKCRDSENTLNVHHVCYRKNTDPWDYPGFLLITLCEYCHSHCGTVNENLLSTFSDVSNDITFLFTQEFPMPDNKTSTEIVRIIIAAFQDDKKWAELEKWYSSLPIDKQLNKVEIED